MSRNIVYKDTKIPQKEYEEVMSEYAAFIKKNAKFTPNFVTVEYDFTDYPTYVDTDGDAVIRPNFLQGIADEVTEKYGEFGADNIITLIHQDNWKSVKTKNTKGIWGTAWSYKFGNYHVQYCRWDKKNPANTFGTINHEQDHSYDSLVKVELGININPILGVKDYDRDTTHGGSYHGYIRYQENAKKLQVLSPYLIAAYKKRLEKHEASLVGKKNTLYKGIIATIEKWLYENSKKLNQKNGNPKT